VGNFARQHGIKLKEKAHFSVLGRGTVAGETVLLVLPQTFMNLSGKAVKEIITRERVDPDKILVVCDDINLEMGRSG